MNKGSLSSVVTTLIDVGWYGALILLGLSACLLVIAPWVDPPRFEVEFAVPVAFGLDADTHFVTATPAGVENVRLDEARGSLKFSPSSHVLVAGAAIVLMAFFTLVVWALGQLRALFRTLRAGTPFVAANATRIRRIGYAVIAGEVVRATLVYAGMRYAMTHFSIQGVRFEARPDLNIVAIICGLIILVIAGVFTEGTRLDEEQSLTV